MGLCRGWGAYTQPCNGKGDAYRYCERCDPGAIRRKWTRELVLVAILDWLNRYGSLPSSCDWSRTHAERRGGLALKRLNGQAWPSASVVGQLFGRRQGPVRQLEPRRAGQEQQAAVRSKVTRYPSSRGEADARERDRTTRYAIAEPSLGDEHTQSVVPGADQLPMRMSFLLTNSSAP